MHRPPLFRFVALLVALLGSLAAPASALTHGWMHDHAAHHHEHDVGFADSGQRERPAADSAHHGPEFETPTDRHSAHGHRALNVGPCAREGHRVATPVITDVDVVKLDELVESTRSIRIVAIASREFLARPDPGGAPPPRLRAPPVG